MFWLTEQVAVLVAAFVAVCLVISGLIIVFSRIVALFDKPKSH